MEGGCDFIDYVVRNSREAVVVQIGGWAGGYKLAVKNQHVVKSSSGPRLRSVVNMMVNLRVL
jgi:hypothetical protein